jgi:hypothetical protein
MLTASNLRVHRNEWAALRKPFPKQKRVPIVLALT